MIQISMVTPEHGFLAVLGQLWGTIHSEIRMQWRRWGLWLAFAGALALILLVISQGISTLQTQLSNSHEAITDIVNYLTFLTTYLIDYLFPPLAALMASDRLVRDSKLAIAEMQQATSQSSGIYILGKFIGNYIAMLVPTLLGILIFGLIFVVLGVPLTLLSSLLLAFVLVFMPVYAAFIGLTLLLSSLLPLRSIQIGIPLLWLYSMLSPFHWYTINNTIFNPNGMYIFPVFFPSPITKVRAAQSITIYSSLLNIGALLGVAIVTLILLGALLQYRRQQGIVK
jgi:hypothetical protein